MFGLCALAGVLVALTLVAVVYQLVINGQPANLEVSASGS
jgi:hypothetical protein